jgi:hypothetical protein
MNSNIVFEFVMFESASPANPLFHVMRACLCSSILAIRVEWYELRRFSASLRFAGGPKHGHLRLHLIQ